MNLEKIAEMLNLPAATLTLDEKGFVWQRLEDDENKKSKPELVGFVNPEDKAVWKWCGYLPE